MSKKSIIQTIIIVACFVGSGVVLYNGLFKNSNPASDSILTRGGGSPGISAEEAILPYGNALDFEGVLKRINQQYGAVIFPILNAQQEVGKDESTLILPESQIP